MTDTIKVLYSEAVLEIDGVKYHHHPNGGGLVAETAEVAPTAYVGLFARVCAYAKVGDYANVCGNARVCAYAKVDACAWVCGERIVRRAKRRS